MNSGMDLLVGCYRMEVRKLKICIHIAVTLSILNTLSFRSFLTHGDEKER